MSTTDMEPGPARPAVPFSDNEAAENAVMTRFVAIVAFGSVIALSAIWLGFHLEDQGKWPFDGQQAPVVIVVD